MPSGDTTSDEVRRLRQGVEWALQQGLGPDDLVPMLRRLIRWSKPDSEDHSFAHRHLGELIVETDPWRAALSARVVLSCHPEDQGAWAILGLAFTIMGHYRAAIRAYRQAVALAPQNPWYAHNLGHLLDVTQRSPLEAVRLLEFAHRQEPHQHEIASSYAHALGRVGRSADARKVLKRHMKGGGTSDQKALLRWLDSMDGADQEQAAGPTAPAAGRKKRSSRRQARTP